MCSRKALFSAVIVAALAGASALAAGTSSTALAVRAQSPAGAASVPAGLGGQVWSSIPTGAKVVALTFDAGGNAAGLPSILSTLRRERVRATFFLTGDFATDFPSESRAIAQAGELIGDHSVSHRYFTKLSNAEIRDQVLGAAKEIASVTHVTPSPWFRFPYGDYDSRAVSVVNSLRYVPIGWTVDTLGWEGTSAGITVQTVVHRVLADLRPGEIVLMHCGSNPKDRSTLDAAALPSVIQQLRSRGFFFVTINSLRTPGYDILTSNGGVHTFAAPWYGSSAGKLAPALRAVGIAVDPATAGYWILKSNGGVDSYNAPWYGSLATRLPAGQSVTGIAAS